MEKPPINVSPFGLSGLRSLADYERHAGIRFAERIISSEAHEGIEPPTIRCTARVSSRVTAPLDGRRRGVRM
jgi:hypothetical protein